MYDALWLIISVERRVAEAGGKKRGTPTFPREFDARALFAVWAINVFAPTFLWGDVVLGTYLNATLYLLGAFLLLPKEVWARRRPLLFLLHDSLIMWLLNPRYARLALQWSPSSGMWWFQAVGAIVALAHFLPDDGPWMVARLALANGGALYNHHSPRGFVPAEVACQLAFGAVLPLITTRLLGAQLRHWVHLAKTGAAVATTGLAKKAYVSALRHTFASSVKASPASRRPIRTRTRSLKLLPRSPDSFRGTSPRT